MTIKEELQKRHLEINNKLTSIALPDGAGTSICEGVGHSLGVTGQTVRNYLSGKHKHKDGYLAEAVYKEFKKLKITK